MNTKYVITNLEWLAKAFDVISEASETLETGDKAWKIEKIKSELLKVVPNEKVNFIFVFVRLILV